MPNEAVPFGAYWIAKSVKFPLEVIEILLHPLPTSCMSALTFVWVEKSVLVTNILSKSYIAPAQFALPPTFFIDTYLELLFLTYNEYVYVPLNVLTNTNGCGLFDAVEIKLSALFIPIGEVAVFEVIVILTGTQTALLKSSVYENKFLLSVTIGYTAFILLHKPEAWRSLT